jgi:putative transposase
VFIAIEIGSRRILHCNVTDHPTAEWTRQQFRAFLDGESDHRYLIHDRDTIFSAEVDEALNGFGLKVLKTPVRTPMANALRAADRDDSPGVFGLSDPHE